MKRCTRCGGSMLSEPYADARSAGVALLCISCGHTEEIASKVSYPETWDRADETRSLRGRPKKAVAG